MGRLFGDMRQVGIVVRDIEAAMRHWVEVCGIGPWFYADRLAVTGRAAMSFDLNAWNARAGKRAESRALPMTLIILALAFGSLIAAGNTPPWPGLAPWLILSSTILI